MPKMDIQVPAGMGGCVALACAALDSGQARLLGLVQDLSPEQLEKVPAGLSNSLATLVVHVAATEVRMAHRLAGRPANDIPGDVRAEYLMDVPQNPLPQPRGETAATLRAKAEKARGMLRDALAGLGDADLEREIVMGPERSGTVRWVLTILPSHQMQHFGQMQMIRKFV